MQPRSRVHRRILRRIWRFFGLSKAARPRSRCHVESFRSPKTPRPRAAARGRRLNGRRGCRASCSGVGVGFRAEPQSLVRAKAIRTHGTPAIGGCRVAARRHGGHVHGSRRVGEPHDGSARALHVVPADSGIYFALCSVREVPTRLGRPRGQPPRPASAPGARARSPSVLADDRGPRRRGASYEIADLDRLRAGRPLRRSRSAVARPARRQSGLRRRRSSSDRRSTDTAANLRSARALAAGPGTGDVRSRALFGK